MFDENNTQGDLAPDPEYGVLVTQLSRNNLEPSFGSYGFYSSNILESQVSVSDPKNGSLVVGPCTSQNFGKNVTVGMFCDVDGTDNCVYGHTTKVTGNRNIVIGGDLKVVGDDQVIIGRIDLVNLLKRIEELEAKVEHLWWMPGGPECKAAELRFNAMSDTMRNSVQESEKLNIGSPS